MAATGAADTDTPGVYQTEQTGTSSSAPAPSGVPIFVGAATSTGAPGQMLTIASLDAFQSEVGSPSADLSAAVEAYFQTGSDPAFVLPVAAEDAASGRVDLADLGRRARKLLESSSKPGETAQLF